MNMQIGKTRKSITKAPPSALNPIQKRPQWLQLWLCSEESKCFWNRYNAAWPLRVEPSSGHALPTAATV